MKVQQTKEGKLKMKVKKPPIISDWKNPQTDAKAARKFGQTLQKGNEKDDAEWEQVSDRKYIRK